MNVVRLAAMLVPWMLGGCYRSEAPRELVDGGGVHVAVVAPDPRDRGFANRLVPVPGAYVVARRCDSSEQHEARTDAAGIAVLPFATISCWTVTAVHPTLPFAASHVAVDPGEDTTIRLAGTDGSAAVPDFAAGATATIVGRSVAGSRVNLVAVGALLGAGPLASTSWVTPGASIEVYRLDASSAAAPSIFGVETDGNATPVGFGRSTFDATNTTHTIDVGAIRGPVHERDRTLSLPTTGALDLGELVGLVASVERTVVELGSPMRFGLGSFGVVERTEAHVTHHVHMRELDVGAASDGLGEARDALILQTAAGRAVTCWSITSVLDLVVPPLAEARVAVTGASAFEVAIGGPEYVPRIGIVRPPTNGSGRSSIWTIVGPPNEVLRLAELPPLPRRRTLADLDLTGLRGARVSAGATFSPHPTDAGVAADQACGLSVGPIEIGP